MSERVTHYSMTPTKLGTWRLYASTTRDGCRLAEGTEDEMRALGRTLGSTPRTLREARAQVRAIMH